MQIHIWSEAIVVISEAIVANALILEQECVSLICVAVRACAAETIVDGAGVSQAEIADFWQKPDAG